MADYTMPLRGHGIITAERLLYHLMARAIRGRGPLPPKWPMIPPSPVVYEIVKWGAFFQIEMIGGDGVNPDPGSTGYIYIMDLFITPGARRML